MGTQAPATRHDTDETDADIGPAARRLLQAVADAACPRVESAAPAGLGVEDDEALLDDPRAFSYTFGLGRCP